MMEYMPEESPLSTENLKKIQCKRIHPGFHDKAREITRQKDRNNDKIGMILTGIMQSIIINTGLIHGKYEEDYTGKKNH